MRVFITGASGLIGRALTKELLGAGHTVIALARSDKAADDLKSSGVDVLRGSLYDLDVLKQGAAASDGVVHLAFVHDWDNFEKSCQTDRQAIQAMADVLTGSNRPLIITTGTLLFPDGHVGIEDDVHDPSSHLAIRAESEVLARSLASQGVRTAIMRLAPGNHGDGDDHLFMSNLISAAREKGVSVYVNDGLNRWPAVHYLDSAAAFRLALERCTAGATYHIVAEEGVNMKEIAEMIGKKLGIPIESKSATEALDHFGHFGHFGVLVGVDNPALSKKTQEALGWTPKQCTLLEDLENGTYFDSQ